MKIMKTLKFSLLLLGDDMKKCLVLSLLLLTACAKTDNNNVASVNDNVPETTTKAILEEVYVDDNPIVVGLYQDGKLVKDYKTNFRVHTDVGYFEVCFTNVDNLGSKNVKRNFNKYYQEYQNIENYKIGYYVRFSTEDKEYEKVILDPSVKHSMDPYLYIYLYDDVHQKDGAWYSHVEMDDVKDNTIYSSIKLYTPSGALKINSPITLTVFTYNGPEDFDQHGYYRGNSKYTIIIEKNA